MSTALASGDDRTGRTARAPRRALRALARRPALAAALVYGLLSLLMFAPGLVPGRALSASDLLWHATPWSSTAPAGIPPLGTNHDQVDSVQVFQPFLQTTRRVLPSVPLWNPSIMGGRPYLADAQSAVFSPLNVPGYALPFWQSLAVMAALKLFVAAFGTYLLARTLGLRFGGALLAGTVFGFSLWMVSWVTWPTTSVWAYLPWLCLLADRLLRRPGPVPFAGLAVAVALQFFAGHPESSFHVLLFTVVFWLVRLGTMRPRGPRRLAGAGAFLTGALVAGTLLAALTLLPFLEAVHNSIDLEARRFLGPSHGATRDLFGLFLHDYWGRQTRTSLVFPSALEESAYYVGALTLMLAVAALVVRPRAERIALAGIGLVALAIATGVPPFFDLVKGLPGFNTAHNARLAVIFVLVAALLAGRGLDELTERVPVRRGALVLAGSAILLVLPVVAMAGAGTLAPERLGSALRVAWGFAHPPSFVPLPSGPRATSLADLRLPTPTRELFDLVRLASLLEWLLPAALGVGLIALRLRGRLGPSAFVALAVLLVAGDLFKAGMGYTPSIPITHAEQPATRAISYLQRHGATRFVGLDAKAPGTLFFPMPPNVAMRYGLDDARGYDYPVERRYYEFWQRYVSTARGCLYAFCGQSAASTPAALRALGVLGVSDLLQDPRDPPLRQPGVKRTYSGADARVYTNPHALPHAFLVERQTVAPDAATALRLVGSPTWARRSVAVTERRLPGLPEGPPPAGRPAGRADLTTYDREREVVHTSNARTALLVVADSWYPGWKATIDGRDAEVHRVDYLIRGVVVPPGDHRVELRYQPTSWRVGWIISLVTSLGLIAAVLVPLRGRRGRSRVARPR
jgi:hypothetical protein